MQLRQSGMTWQVVGDEVVVLDLDGSVYFKVNGSGKLLWERLVEPATTAELVEVLTTNFDVDDERAAADVDAFVAQLRTKQLVEE